MFKINIKKILSSFIIVIAIFFLDRVSKNYILDILETNNVVDIYITSYLNLYLIWNSGIAFGLFSFDEIFIYNLITFIIASITIVILVMIISNQGFRKYCLLVVLGGSLGNLFDRVYYSAVPDFIDFHINNFHWFVFNVADIFITLGIVCLICAEIFNHKESE